MVLQFKPRFSELIKAGTKIHALIQGLEPKVGEQLIMLTESPYIKTGCIDLDPNWPNEQNKPRGSRFCVQHPHCKCGMHISSDHIVKGLQRILVYYDETELTVFIDGKRLYSILVEEMLISNGFSDTTDFVNFFGYKPEENPQKSDKVIFQGTIVHWTNLNY